MKAGISARRVACLVGLSLSGCGGAPAAGRSGTPEQPTQIEASSPGLARIDLGSVTAGSTYAFHLDAAVASVTLVLAGDADATYVFDHLMRPDGRELIGGSCPKGSTSPLACGVQRASPGRGTAILQLPDSDRVEAQAIAGTWTFQFASAGAAASAAHAFLYVKRMAASPQPTLNLNFFFAAGVLGSGVVASNGLQAPAMQAILSRYRDFFEAQAGIQLGLVQLFDLDAQYADILSAEDYGAMFAAHARNGGVNVFLVRSLEIETISNQAVPHVAGVSGSIPGLPEPAGQRQGGIVVEVQEDIRLTGNAVAHEIGHYLNLYHVIEPGSGLQDPISDTPRCASADSCGAAADLLMFYALSPGQHLLTAGQAAVVRANANVL